LKIRELEVHVVVQFHREATAIRWRRPPVLERPRDRGSEPVKQHTVPVFPDVPHA
jgi:hypothetical protein